MQLRHCQLNIFSSKESNYLSDFKNRSCLSFFPLQNISINYLCPGKYASPVITAGFKLTPNVARIPWHTPYNSSLHAHLLPDSTLKTLQSQDHHRHLRTHSSALF